MFEVQIKVVAQKVIVEMLNKHEFSNLENYKFAFYLYKNNKRIDTIWYKKESKAVFSLENTEGIYYVRAFAQNIESSEIKGYNSKIISQRLPIYDVLKWKRPIFDTDVDRFSKLLTIQNGIYQFEYNGQKIDILFEGIERLEKERGVLVCLSGAVANRQLKSAPFFSGLNVAKNTNMPIVSISDPSLAISNSLSLGWYAGSKDMKNLSYRIAEILDTISRVLNTKLTLFGGSGGGFAVLSIILEMSSNVNGVVWNPQTSITKYLEASVSKYVRTCFTDGKPSNDNYITLDTNNIHHDLVSLYSRNRTKFTNILYIQNIGDKHHVINHAQPLIEALSAERDSEYIYRASNNLTFWLKYWGEGHIVPSEKIMMEAINGLIENKSSYDIALEL